MFIGLWIIMFIFLNVIPMLYSFYLSLTSYDGLTVPRFLGFKNYLTLLRDYRFIGSLVQTVKFTFLNIVATLTVSLLLANFLNKKMKGQIFFRGVLFLPYAVPVIASVFIWKTLLNRESGLINLVLGMINSKLSLDADKIDGASQFLIFRRITIPLLSPLIMYQAIVGIMLSFSVIVQPILLTSSPGAAFTAFLNQQPPYQNFFTLIFIFQQAFTNQSFGIAMAATWYMILVMFVLALIFLRASKRFVYYEYE